MCGSANQNVLKALGSDCINHISIETGSGGVVKTVPPAPSSPLGNNFTRVWVGSPSVMELFLSGSAPGDNSVKDCHDDRCVPEGTGSDTHGQSSERHLSCGSGP